jgi:hypothetical protein
MSAAMSAKLYAARSRVAELAAFLVGRVAASPAADQSPAHSTAAAAMYFHSQAAASR